MKKMLFTFISLAILSTSSTAFAKSNEPNIAQDTAKLPADLTLNLAQIAIGGGVKEPLNISKEGQNAKISGSNATVCAVKLSAQTDTPKILGISCK